MVDSLHERTKRFRLARGIPKGNHRQRSVDGKIGPARGVDSFASGPFVSRSVSASLARRKRCAKVRHHDAALRGVRGGKLSSGTGTERRRLGNQDREAWRRPQIECADASGHLFRFGGSCHKTLATSSEGSGASGRPHAARQPEGKLTSREREQQWVDLWAFGTSPYGLGLSSETFWALTGRELTALKTQWARTQAQALNLQAATDGVPFIAEDFLGLSDRAERIAQAQVDKDVAEVQAAMENARLLSLRMGASKIDETGIPQWMKEAKRGR